MTNEENTIHSEVAILYQSDNQCNLQIRNYLFRLCYPDWWYHLQPRCECYNNK